MPKRQSHLHTHTYDESLPHHRSFTHSHPYPDSNTDPLAFKGHTHADGVTHSHPHLRDTHTDAKSYREPEPG